MGVHGRAFLALVAVICAGCDKDAAPPAVPTPEAASAAAEPRAPDVAVRLRATALQGADSGAVRQAVADAFARIGLAIVDDGTARDADILLTVSSTEVAEGSATRRTTLTLSTTIGEHEMEDISGHFVRADGGVDAVTVRELCQRWRRRFQRFQSALARDEAAR